MSSRTDIANRALLLLGAAPVLDLNDNLDQAKVMKAFYDPAKRATLRAYPWNCATRHYTLAELSPAPLWGYNHRYQLPPELVRVFELERVHQLFWDGDDGLWQVYERELHTNETPCNIRGVVEINESLFDASFEEAFVARLAAEAAYPLTASNTNVSNMHALFAQKLSEAKTMDSVEGATRVTRSSRLTRARASGRRGLVDWR